MTPGARISAAIECLDQIFAGMPAEKALTGWARKSRFAGSKDRAAVRDHVFDALRNRDSFAVAGGGLSGRSVMIGLARLQDLPISELFSGEGHSPAPLDSEEALLSLIDWHWDMSEWCAAKLETSFPESARQIADALKQRAPVDLRVNRRKMSRDAAISMLRQDDIDAEAIDLSDTALRIVKNPRKVKSSQAYSEGVVELQDAGSQALVDILPLENSQRVLDYCAGGGGKALATAARCNAEIYAHDIDAHRMKDIPIRAKRADANIKCITTDDLGGIDPFDLVLVDAPCSGSGAWRRSPDAKWRLTRERFDDLLSIQSDVLDKASRLVSPAGYLTYATCSLFAEENEDQVNAFLKNRPDYRLISQNSWTPLNGCDGFYTALMQLQGQ